MASSASTRSARPVAPRGIFGQVSALLMHPQTFFRALPTGQSWLVVALGLFLLTGVSELQRQARLAPAGTGDNPAITDPAMGGDMGGMPMGDGGVPLPPPDMGGEPTANASESNITADLTRILMTGSNLVAAWLVQAVLLSVVTLGNGYAPRLGRNVQVAVWASVPLGVLALMQLVYYAAGGKAGEPGLVGLVDEWQGYASLAPDLQSIVLSIASKLTIFHLWTLVLLFIGGRYALKGKRVIVGFAVAAWLIALVVLPVLTGSIAATPTLPEAQVLPEAPIMVEGEVGGDSMGEGEMPPADTTAKPVMPDKRLPSGAGG